jgi:hypothetical protein
MHRVRLHELMRTWLETLSRSEDAGVAAMASCALELHEVLGSRRPVPDRAAAATRYVSLVETLVSSAARPSRTARGLDEREVSPVDALASGDLERFWSQALQNLKSHIEAESMPPTGEPPPRKLS